MTTPRKTARYGWRPDIPDARDRELKAVSLAAHALTPPSVDLRHLCAPIFDQGDLGSCVANAAAACHEFAQAKEREAHIFRPSRLFIYYECRVVSGTTDYDSGAQIRDAMKVLNQLGTCPEYEWPYDIGKFTRKPPQSRYVEALSHQTLLYARVGQAAADLEACLAAGYPVAFGFTVYESFESDSVAQSGVVPLPNLESEHVVGGHAVVMVGYDRAAQRFICRNSWGTGWGMAGYFTMPYAYVLYPSLASDFWTIRSVE